MFYGGMDEGTIPAPSPSFMDNAALSTTLENSPFLWTKACAAISFITSN